MMGFMSRNLYLTKKKIIINKGQYFIQHFILFIYFLSVKPTVPLKKNSSLSITIQSIHTVISFAQYVIFSIQSFDKNISCAQYVADVYTCV